MNFADRFVFRSFVLKLSAENDHTFSIIRMIPRHLVKDIKEIDDFLKEMASTKDV
jgi:hypothetical protein